MQNTLTIQDAQNETNARRVSRYHTGNQNPHIEEE